MQLVDSYVLTTKAYRETSLLVTLFTKTQGKINCIIRGTRNPRSTTKNLLQPCIPLLVKLRGKGSLPYLQKVEASYQLKPITGKNIIIAMYLNELIYHLCHWEIAYPELFEIYQQTLLKISNNTQQLQYTIRLFELNLLKFIGYGLQLKYQADSYTPINPQKLYYYHPAKGPMPISANSHYQPKLLGQTLQLIQVEKFNQPDNLQQVKKLLRSIIDYRLGSKQLISRKLYSNCNFDSKPSRPC